MSAITMLMNNELYSVQWTKNKVKKSSEFRDPPGPTA